ncbi:MAG: PDZ domain-containing protein, partial [Ignavibacteria bacterium]
LFEKYVIELDYQNKILNMYNPDNYQYKGNGKQIPIFVHGVPYTKATVILPNNESIEGTFMIDNGFAGEVSFTTQFCLNHNLPGQMKNSVPSIQTGGGGNSGNKVGRINALIFGGYKLDNPTAALSSDTKGGMARKDIAGLIGSGILKHFKVVFDYWRSRMILKPYDSAFESMDWDMSGMFLYSEGNNFDQFYIYNVIPGSPADEAGIKGGDQIISIDGTNASSYSLDEIAKMFKLNGKQYKIVLLRDNKKINVEIKLHKMI